jgi:hypothetical protein
MRVLRPFFTRLKGNFPNFVNRAKKVLTRLWSSDIIPLAPDGKAERRGDAKASSDH